MSTEPSKPTREELLEELENIRASLLPENGEAPAPGVIDAATANLEKITKTSDTMAENDEENTAAPGVLPGQQSLFEGDSQKPAEDTEKTEDAEKTEEAKNTKAQTPAIENPFLPQHIREKLDQERAMYQQKIEAAARVGSSKQAEEIDETAVLIDEIVAEYLPKIENELRLRLSERIAKSQE